MSWSANIGELYNVNVRIGCLDVGVVACFV